MFRNIWRVMFLRTHLKLTFDLYLCFCAALILFKFMYIVIIVAYREHKKKI
jgi:hypothetical protein